MHGPPTGRDGFPSDPEHIFLTAGASAGVSQLLNVCLSPGDGVLVPIPQYPLYTATLAALSCHPVPYQLQESSGWSLSQPVLQSAIDSVDRAKTPIKALVVINPGNPTGGCLEESDMREIVRMCYDQGLVLMADEVYQTNIYYPETKPFVSFKKVLRTMEDEPDSVIEKDCVELISFHSLSKGVSGECGRRGGYFELVNIDEQVVDQIYKMASISLCPPVTGQVGVDLLVDPPKPGEPSYAQYEKETSITHQSLLDRSAYMSEKFNALEGMSCQKAEGAMYLFPSIEMPDKALKEAEKRGKPADVMYALDLLGEHESSGPRACPSPCSLTLRPLSSPCLPWRWNRRHRDLCGRRVRIRTKGRNVSSPSHCALPRGRGLCRQDRDVPQGFHEEIRLVESPVVRSGNAVMLLDLVNGS